MKVTITSHAQKQIKKLPKTIQIILVTKVRSLVLEPNLKEEKLSGYKNLYRIRVGVYRMVYIKFPNEIEIVLVGHRREVYKLLERV